MGVIMREISMENEIQKLINEENKRNEEIFINQPFKRKLNPEKARKEDQKILVRNRHLPR